MIECTRCPFYEDHWGEYYQGCWEFYDLCWAAPDLGTSPNCRDDCFIIQEDEAVMLKECLAALDKKREIKCRDGSSVYRDLTDSEKDNIIRDMEAFMKVFNEVRTPVMYYK